MRRFAVVVTTMLIVGCQVSPTATLVPSTGEPTPAVSPGTSQASPPPLSESPPATGSPPPSAPPASAPPGAGSWQRIADIEAFRDLQLDEVVWTGARFVASSGQFLLDSEDGRLWHRGQRIDSFGFLEFALGPEGIVAVSDTGTWFSRDGLDWTPARRNKDLEPEDGRVLTLSGVVAADNGWLAVGADSVDCPFNCGAGGATPAVWRSSDGIVWVRQATEGLFENARFSGIAKLDGGFVAVGAALVRRSDHAAVWLSADGRRWNRIADSDVFGAPPDVAQGFVGMTDVVAGRGIVVAVGQASSQDVGGSALAWYSTDRGATWSRAAGERFLDGQIFSAAAIPSGGFVATGPSGRASCWGGIWLSRDGTGWDCVAEDKTFNRFAAYAGAASPATLVVVGFGGGEHKLEAVVWLHDLGSLEELR